MSGEDDLLVNCWDGLASVHSSHHDLTDTLGQSYEAAKRDGNWAKRLFHALQMSKRGGSADDFVVYGIECGRNAMPERAEEAFNAALRLDPKSVVALNGLAMCSFERGELGKAEELYRKAMKVEPNEHAEKMQAKIGNLRAGEPWVKRAEARRKFWKHWTDTELTRLSAEQRQKRMGEIVVRRR